MWEQVQIAFPGLGIDTFTVNKVAFEIFGLEIRWYGILITLGMICAFAYATYRSKSAGFSYDDVMDMGLYVVIFGVIGARLYYVLMKLDRYIIPGRGFFDTVWDMINLRGGGLAIYGGVLAGVATIIIYSKIKKKNWCAALDMVGPGVMIAQAMGRWGNFFNGEAYGGIVPETHPLYFLRMGLYPNDLVMGEMAYVHPTFLYESLWNILGFVLINVFLFKRKKFHGQVALAYLGWYGFGRMFIEGLRTDSLYIFGTVRVSQMVGFLCFVICTGLTVWMLVCLHRNGARAKEYQPVYTAADTGSESSKDAEDSVASPEPSDTSANDNDQKM